VPMTRARVGGIARAVLACQAGAVTAERGLTGPREPAAAAPYRHDLDGLITLVDVPRSR
jgi:hypothetical protein